MLYKTIHVGDRMVRFGASADTPRQYRLLFGSDLLKDLVTLTDDNLNIEVLNQIAYCMAKAADDSIGEMSEWLDQFALFDVISAMPELLDLWGMNTATKSKAKKK